MKPKIEMKMVWVSREYTGRGKQKKMFIKVYELDGTLIASAIHFQKTEAE